MAKIASPGVERSMPIEDAATRPASTVHKNKKRWCRGKVGVEHKLVGAVLTTGFRGLPQLVRYCTSCGREDETFWDFGSSRRNPPAWVTPKMLAALDLANQKYNERIKRERAA